jgi:hypothetical protein
MAGRAVSGNGKRRRDAHAVGGAASICSTKCRFQRGRIAHGDDVGSPATAAVARAQRAITPGAASTERARANVDALATASLTRRVVVRTVHHTWRNVQTPAGDTRRHELLHLVRRFVLAVDGDVARERHRFAARAARRLGLEHAGIGWSARSPVDASCASAGARGSRHGRAAFRGRATQRGRSGRRSRSRCSRTPRRNTPSATDGPRRPEATTLPNCA